MPYCVVYGCKSNSSLEQNVHWFSFPKDQSRLKAWIHYCKRKDFTPTKHSRICGKHFSVKQYKIDPSVLAGAAEEGFAGKFRHALKADAVPDVLFEERGDTPAPKKPRAAFEKRRLEDVSSIKTYQCNATCKYFN